MTEDEARQWVLDRHGVSRETRLAQYIELLREGAEHQNLVAPSTLDHVWTRHVVDSAQLLPLAPASGQWIDVGSGAGLPGIAVAILAERPVMLVEPRARRVEFLRSVVATLDLGHVSVVAQKIERVQTDPAAVISARAVAELSILFAAAEHCADLSTVWLLPKGRSADSEVAGARRAWQGLFHVEPSITQPDSGIVVAREVRRKR